MAISREVHQIVAADGLGLRLTRIFQDDTPRGVPVLMVHGAGVSSNIFCPPRPGDQQLQTMLAKAGFDVWNLDWRASIDLPPNHWTLDRAAVLDYPAVAAFILDQTHQSEIRALIHCQGSTSFMIALVAGLLPQVSVVIANAVSLHPVVPPLARHKALRAVPSLGRLMPWLNPQWGISAPPGLPRLFDIYVRSIHHECNNPVCKWASFTYGSGFPTLWSHANLNAATHDWIAGQFANVPMTFFRQMSASIRAGHLVSTGEFAQLPRSVVEAAPRSDARIVLLAGTDNACFLPEAQGRSFDFLDAHAPGRHSLVPLAGYGHLDVFIGKDAPRDVFPLIVEEFQKG